ncbi:protein kinase domain-containing protein [Blastopirellula marina]|uniref:Putative threonine/tyrosine-specific protein kinase n=1 Tax=Blastopirellula marina DSM 3645 TaxID=314230 RepID=A3ZNS4_9BACT|nr:protein kinase [Blastopirellula marina]EAQ81972.1 putative threonine/tyrosine-specific protein kinase [Blastopirellula marina DSM 3645]
MFVCPQCAAQLTDTQQSEGRCPDCGVAWDAEPAIGGTIDLPDSEDLGQTYEFDLVDDNPDKSNPSAASSSDATTLDGRQGTVEIETPDPAEAREVKQTIDLPDAEAAPVPPRSILESPASGGAESSPTHPPSDEEFEFSLSSDAEEVEEATEVNRTIDLPPPNSSPGDTIDLPDHVLSAQNTLDLPDGGGPIFGQTLDLPSDGAGRTIDLPPDLGIGQTVDSVGADNSEFDLALGSQPLSADGVRRYWDGAENPGDSPLTSLKTATVAKGRELGVEIRERILAKNAQQGVSSDYELINILGEGGMGTVYAADQKSVRRRVAIKTLKNKGGKRKDDRAKFLSEAVLTGFLDHPNIVPIHELGQTGDGTLFYSMKLVSGTPWHEAIRNKTELENLEYLDRVCDAVAFAHSRGVIHRDLKPENVMLGEYGEVLVMDWGLAVDLNRGDHFSMGGTPAYMAPEMVRGPIETIGIGSDIYLLGAILYEIVTGAPPHAAKTVTECLVAAAENKITPVESSSTLLKIALRAMSSEISHRHVSVAQFQSAIREYQFHSQSLGMAARAREDLEEARTTQNYEQFSRSLFGFQDAMDLWPKNDAAIVGFRDARRAYAECALAKADFDLGLQQLDENDPETQALYAALIRGQTDRRLAQSRKRFAQVSAIAAMLLLMVGAVAFGVVVYGKNAAIAKERDNAEVQRQRAVKNEEQAVKEKNAADAAKKVAENERAIANAAKLTAEMEKAAADKAKLTAEKEKAAADVARETAVNEKALADIARAEAEFAAVFSRIGLAQAKIEANDIGRAIELLEQVPKRFRNWEWGHLYDRCHADVPQIDALRPITAVALSPQGDLSAAGGTDGIVSLYSQAEGAIAQKSLNLQGASITSIAFAPPGDYLLIGCDDPQQPLVAWYPANDEKQSILVRNIFVPERIDSRYHVERITFHPESGVAYIAANGYLFSVASPEATAKPLRYFTDGLNAVSLSSDGSTLLLAGGNVRRGQIETLDLETTETSAELALREIPIAACWIAPGIAAVATSDGAMSTWTVGDSEVLEFDRLNSRVNSLDYNPQTGLLAAAMEDGSICVWNVTGSATQPTRGKTLRGHLDVVSSARWSKDGKTLVSGSVDQHLRFWDYEAYRDQLTIQHDHGILTAAYSSDGRLAATGDSGGVVRIFQPGLLNGGDVLELHEGDWLAESRATEFGAQFVGPNHLVTQIGGVSAAVWRLDTTEQVSAFPVGGNSVAIAASPDGEHFALQDGEASLLRICDFSGNETTIAQRAKAWGLDFSPSGNKLAIAKLVMASIYSTQPASEPLIWKRAMNGVKQIGFLEEDVVAIGSANGAGGGVAVLETESGSELAEFRAKEDESYQFFCLSPDRTMIAVLLRRGAESEHVVRIWRPRSETIAETSVPYEVRSAAFTAEGNLLLASERDVALWDLKGEPRSIPGVAQAAASNGRKIGGVISSPTSDDEFAIYFTNRDVEIWNTMAGRIQRLNSARSVIYVGFSRDDSEVIAVHSDGMIRRWSVIDGKKIGQWTTSSNDVTSAALVDDKLAIACRDASLTIFDWKTGKPVAEGKLDSAALDMTWASQPHDQLIAGCVDGQLRIVSGETAQQVGEPFGKHNGSYLGVAMDADSKRLAAVSSDRKVRVWLEVDLAAGKIGKPLTHDGHSAEVNSVAFSADGRRLVTGSSDSMVIVWYVDRPDKDKLSLMREIMPLRGHQKGIKAIKFSPQKTDLMTAGDDGRATIWFAVDWQEEQNAPQPMTEEE